MSLKVAECEQQTKTKDVFGGLRQSLDRVRLSQTRKIITTANSFYARNEGGNESKS